MDSNNKSLQIFSDNSLTPTQTKALTNYMPENFMPVVKSITTITQLLERKTSSLIKIKKQVGTIRTEALIKVYLVRLNDLLDLKKSLSEVAINEIASILVSDYGMLSMIEIVFVINQAIKGKYGELFESLNIPKVIRWFETYFNERCQIASQSSIDDKNNHNSLFGKERSSNRPDEQREFAKQYALNKMIEKHNNRSK